LILKTTIVVCEIKKLLCNECIFLMVNSVLTKNEGPYPKKIVRKTRNSCWVNSGGVGAHGQLTRSSNGLSPETNTNAQRILLVSIALTLVFLGTKLLEVPAQFLIGSLGTLTETLCLYQNWLKSGSARPYESCKIFKGQPRRNAFSKLVHCQYKSFPTDRFCQIEMKNPTRMSNKTSNEWSWAEDQILKNKNLRNMILNICTEQ